MGNIHPKYKDVRILDTLEANMIFLIWKSLSWDKDTKLDIDYIASSLGMTSKSVINTLKSLCDQKVVEFNDCITSCKKGAERAVFVDCKNNLFSDFEPGKIYYLDKLDFPEYPQVAIKTARLIDIPQNEGGKNINQSGFLQILPEKTNNQTEKDRIVHVTPAEFRTLLVIWPELNEENTQLNIIELADRSGVNINALRGDLLKLKTKGVLVFFNYRFFEKGIRTVQIDTAFENALKGTGLKVGIFNLDEYIKNLPDFNKVLGRSGKRRQSWATCKKDPPITVPILKGVLSVQGAINLGELRVLIAINRLLEKNMAAKIDIKKIAQEIDISYPTFVTTITSLVYKGILERSKRSHYKRLRNDVMFVPSCYKLESLGLSVNQSYDIDWLTDEISPDKIPRRPSGKKRKKK